MNTWQWLEITWSLHNIGLIRCWAVRLTFLGISRFLILWKVVYLIHCRNFFYIWRKIYWQQYCQYNSFNWRIHGILLVSKGKLCQVKIVSWRKIGKRKTADAIFKPAIPALEGKHTCAGYSYTTAKFFEVKMFVSDGYSLINFFKKFLILE